jgi:TPR repeat protein
MLRHGEGIEKNVQEAIKILTELAEKNIPEVWLMLGKIYELGDEIHPDYIKAAKFYRKAADRDISEAQFLLGNLFSRGIGLTKDLVHAHAWFNLAAINGFHLGDLSAAQLRDELGKNMSLDQIERAQTLAKSLRKLILTNINAEKNARKDY